MVKEILVLMLYMHSVCSLDYHRKQNDLKKNNTKPVFNVRKFVSETNITKSVQTQKSKQKLQIRTKENTDLYKN